MIPTQHTRPALRLISRVALMAIALPAALGAQTATQRAEAESLFSDLTEHTPGAAVVVVRQGSVVFQVGYGMADLDQAVRITPVPGRTRASEQ